MVQNESVSQSSLARPSMVIDNELFIELSPWKLDFVSFMVDWRRPEFIKRTQNPSGRFFGNWFFGSYWVSNHSSWFDSDVCRNLFTKIWFLGLGIGGGISFGRDAIEIEEITVKL